VVNQPVTDNNDVSECPECGAGVKSKIEPNQDLTLLELTESEIRQGEYFHCLLCEVAWSEDERVTYEFPVMSSAPNGYLEPISAGTEVHDSTQSNFRLLGYGEDNTIILRDVGDLAFSRGDPNSLTHPDKLENQLGEVIEVTSSGYPNDIQYTLNALRPGYCINATIGTAGGEQTLEIDARESCRIVEAVPVGYAIGTDYVPVFADTVWDDETINQPPGNGVPQTRRTIHNESGPAADVYVFPSGLQDENGVPLLTGMQHGLTHHLEKFSTNFTGVFNGGIIDVIFIDPSNRPYFAVYCLGGDCLALSHELRADLGLPVVHRGWDADRTEIYDIRFNPHYVERTTVNGSDVLAPQQSGHGVVDIESGNATGSYFEVTPQPHELVVTAPDDGKRIEVARLRAPTARIN
jgi:hypothetical protein